MTKQAELANAMLAKLPGTRVFVLPPLTKIPHGKGWPSQATDDAELIESWFEALPDSNVGLVIGPNVAVIDVEGPKKKREEARRGLAELSDIEEAVGPLPPTVTVCTPSGGLHKYYLLPAGLVINRKAKLLGANGVELRTGINFVLIPPSHIDYVEDDHRNYGNYVFADGLGLHDVAVATLPSSWVEAILKEDNQRPLSRAEFTQSCNSEVPGREPQFEPIVAGCTFIRHVVEDVAGLSEPDWYAGLSVVSRCHKGRSLAHKISEPYTGYTAAETDRKVDHALAGSAPVTCSFISSELGFAGCQNCPFRAGDMRSPIALGYQDQNLVEVQSRFVYVVGIERYIDIATGRFYTRTAVSDLLQHHFEKNPHRLLMASRTMPKVAYIDYLVGDNRLIIENDGSKLLNIWRRDGVEPCGGDCSVLLKFIEYLIPDQTSREHFLDYLGCLLQRRGIKIAHGLILTGKQGTGKSTLARIMNRLLGRNVHKIQGQRLASKWNETLVNCELLISEETALSGKWEIYNDLKELITEEVFTVEQKNVPPYQGRTPRGVLIISNYEAPLCLPDDDRRYCVIASVDEKASQKFFEEINNAITTDAQIGAFAKWLLMRDLCRFDPNAAPPMTAAKQAAVAASRTPLAQIVSEAIENGTLKGDVVTVEAVLRIISSGPYQITMNISPQKAAATLKQLGAVKLSKVRTPNGASTNPWALRNQELWKNATPDEIRKELGWLQPVNRALVDNVVELAMRQASNGLGAA